MFYVATMWRTGKLGKVWEIGGNGEWLLRYVTYNSIIMSVF